jgi:hypothetical protein
VKTEQVTVLFRGVWPTRFGPGSRGGYVAIEPDLRCGSVVVVEMRNRLEKTALTTKAPGQTRAVMAYGRGLDPGYSRATRVKLGTALRDELAAREPAPPTLMRLLAELDVRMRADTESDRLYAAFDRAVEQVVRLNQDRS